MSDSIARRWLESHGGIRATKRIESALHLELSWGGCIRNDCDEGITADGLSYWILATYGVSVTKRTAQTWLDRDWNASDKLYRPEAVEAELGDRLRLVEYKHQFADEAALMYHINILTPSSGSVVSLFLFLHLLRPARRHWRRHCWRASHPFVYLHWYCVSGLHATTQTLDPCGSRAQLPWRKAWATKSASSMLVWVARPYAKLSASDVKL